MNEGMKLSSTNGRAEESAARRTKIAQTEILKTKAKN